MFHDRVCRGEAKNGRVRRSGLFQLSGKDDGQREE
jgi:hypothetical protein